MKPNIHSLILCMAALAFGSPALAQNQDAAALLAEVWAAHGVTASLLDENIQLQGRYQLILQNSGLLRSAPDPGFDPAGDRSI